MTSLLGDTPLFRKIMLSILTASITFLTLLTLIVYYSNEILEDDLLSKQTEFELETARGMLAENPDARLPRSTNLSIYLDSRADRQAIPGHLLELEDGVHHNLKVDGRSYHVMVDDIGGDRIYIQLDISQIEQSEKLLELIIAVAWAAMLIVIFVISRLLSRKLAGPIAQLSDELSSIGPDARGVRLSDRYEDDEVGKIAQAFDSYSRKMDDYVEKQIAFAAMASHELRSPLTIIQTSTDLIASQNDNDAISPHLDKIRRATTSMGNMIHALLAVTRDRPVGVSVESIALAGLVDDIVEIMRSEIETKHIEVESDIARDFEIEADRTLVTVVLTNLIKNAVKHGQHSAIRITCDRRSLSITDTGIGLDEDSLKKIFVIGYRGQQSEGYGVGLYISKLVCDYFGWSLQLMPNPGGGIVARIEFAG